MSARTYGRLYGASLGPGDPGLITRQVWALLQREDLYWTYPVRRKGADSHALGIVQRAGRELPSTGCPLIFPMTHDPEILAGYWLRAAEAVLERLWTGQDVMFLVEGDASTYSTFGYLSRTVRALEAEVRIETLPGVSSYHAAAATVGMPLAETDETIAIIPASYGIEMIERLLPDFDTLVLLKVKPLLDDILDLLERRGLLAHAAFIEKLGTPLERVERALTRLRGHKVNYLSLMLVRNPERVRGTILRGCRKKSSSPDMTCP